MISSAIGRSGTTIVHTKALESFKNSLIDIGKFFGLEFDLTNLEKDYQQFYDKNTILQTHNLPIEYLNGNTNIKLDVLQQAYVDAQKN